MPSPIIIYDPEQFFPNFIRPPAEIPQDHSRKGIVQKGAFDGAGGNPIRDDGFYVGPYTEDSMPPGGISTRVKTHQGRTTIFWKSLRDSATSWYESWRQRYIRGGGDEANWPLGEFNRTRYFAKHYPAEFYWDNDLTIDPTRQPGREFGDESGGQQVQVGGYVAHPTTSTGTGGQEDATEYWDPKKNEGAGGYMDGHTYHHGSIPLERVWHQMIIDPKPIHNRSSSSTESPYHHRPFETAYPDYGYFDLTRDFYAKWRGGMKPLPGNDYCQALYSRWEVFKDDDAGTGAIVDEISLVDHVSSLAGSYQPASNQFYITYATRRRVYTVQIRYSFATTYGQSFDALTPLTVNGERTTDGNAYEGQAFLETIDWQGNPFVYVAFRVKENPEYGHREICIPTDPQVYPPLPGGVFP